MIYLAKPSAARLVRYRNTYDLCACLSLSSSLSFPHNTTMAPSNCFPDWMGVPEPAIQASGNFSDGLENISSFDERTNDVLNLDSTTGPSVWSPQPNEAFDYQTQPSPFAPSFFAPSFSPTPFGDPLSTVDSLDHPVFPTFDQISLDAAGASKILESEFPPQEDEYFDYRSICSGSIPYGELPIESTSGSVVKSPPLRSPSAVDFVAAANDYDNLCPGYPLMQHTVGAAGAGAPGLMTGMDMNVDPTAFTFMARSLDPFPPQGSSHGHVRALARPSERTTETDSGAAGTSQLNGNQPEQDTTKRYSCDHEGCNLSKCAMLSLSSGLTALCSFLQALQPQVPHR